MKNLDTVMKWEEAEAFFIENILPSIRITEASQGGGIDLPLRRESWNNWTDALCKNGEISDWQYENWGHPECSDREVPLYKTTPGTRRLF